MRKLKDIIRLIRAKHYAVLIGDSQDEISWAIESLRTADNLSKHSAIVIKGEVYELASYGVKHTDGSRSATLRLPKNGKKIK